MCLQRQLVHVSLAWCGTRALRKNHHGANAPAPPPRATLLPTANALEGGRRQCRRRRRGVVRARRHECRPSSSIAHHPPTWRRRRARAHRRRCRSRDPSSYLQITHLLFSCGKEVCVASAVPIALRQPVRAQLQLQTQRGNELTGGGADARCLAN